MFCRSIYWLLCISLAAATPDEISGIYVITESGPEVTVSPLTSENLESDPEVTISPLTSDNLESNPEVTISPLTSDNLESDPEVPVSPSTSDNLESSSMEPDQEVKKTAAVVLSSLLDAGAGAKVTLVAGDTRLSVHRAVLAARSPVFAAILDDASRVVVTVTDVEGPVLQLLVAYMYTLKAPRLPSMAPQLLVAADRYGMSALKAICEQQVAAHLSVDNAVATALLALNNSYDSLRQASTAFIKAHIFDVMATKGWADAMRSQPADLIEVIQLVSSPSAQTSDQSQTAATAVPPMGLYTTSSTDDAVVSHVWNLSDEESSEGLIDAAKQETVERMVSVVDEATTETRPWWDAPYRRAIWKLPPTGRRWQGWGADYPV